MARQIDVQISVQTNGAERLNGTLKQALTKQVQSGLDWVDSFPLVLYYIRLHDYEGLVVSLKLFHGFHRRNELDNSYMLS